MHLQGGYEGGDMTANPIGCCKEFIARAQQKGGRLKGTLDQRLYIKTYDSIYTEDPASVTGG